MATSAQCCSALTVAMHSHDIAVGCLQFRACSTPVYADAAGQTPSVEQQTCFCAACCHAAGMLLAHCGRCCSCFQHLWTSRGTMPCASVQHHLALPRPACALRRPTACSHTTCGIASFQATLVSTRVDSAGAERYRSALLRDARGARTPHRHAACPEIKGRVLVIANDDSGDVCRRCWC